MIPARIVSNYQEFNSTKMKVKRINLEQLKMKANRSRLHLIKKDIPSEIMVLLPRWT